MANGGNHLRARAAKLAAAADRLKRQSGPGLKTGAKTGAPFSLAFMTDGDRTPHPEMIARILPRGAAVILRDYDDPKRAALARRLASICKAGGVYLIIGANVENGAALAGDIGAAGVHLPSWMLAAQENPPLAPPGMIVTAACHGPEELARAALAGADLALLSPVFATQSHPGAAALGPDAFKQMAAAAALPVLALGGVDETTARQLQGPNIAGFAAISAFLRD